MTDRILKVEFAPLFLENVDQTGGYVQSINSDYRPLATTNDQYWVSEHKLDLSGYVQSDLTVFFKNSFEQRGGSTNYQWIARGATPALRLQPYDAANFELTIISSVPLNDEQLTLTVLTAPGFTPLHITGGVDYGNFDRTHIIHGNGLVWSLDASLGADVFTSNGGGYGSVVQSWDFSSLEPTAADCLYCYRMIALSEASKDAGTGFTDVQYPAKRVLLSMTTDEEPHLEYMMRLKRSYELANQV